MCICVNVDVFCMSHKPLLLVCPQELEKRAKALKDSSEELRKEVSQRRQEIHSLLEDMEARHKLMTREQRELDHKKDIIVNNQVTGWRGHKGWQRGGRGGGRGWWQRGGGGW